MERDDYRFGIPEEKNYEIAFSSDDIRYGGKGIPEKEIILSEKIAMHGKSNSIAVDIPPMSVMYLKPSSIQPEPKVIDVESSSAETEAEPAAEQPKPKTTRKKAASTKPKTTRKKATSEETAQEKPKTTRKKTAAAKEKTEEKPKRTRKKAAEKIEE